MSPIEPDFSHEQGAASAAHTVQKTKTLPVPVGFFRRVWARAAGTLRIFLDADGIRAGAATAFYGAFSVAPLLVILTSIAAWIWGDMANMSGEVAGDQAARAMILDTLCSLLGEREAETLAGMLNRGLASITAGRAISSTLFAVATTLIGASGMFIELRTALQAMAEQAAPRRFNWTRFVRMRIVIIGVVLGCACLVAAVMLLQTLALGFVKWVAFMWPALAGIVRSLELFWSWTVIVGLFYIVMHWLPDRRFPCRATLAGAALGGVLFMAGRIAISYYIATTVTRSSLGAASSFAALLVWIFWSSLVFLLGAAFAGELTKSANARR